MCVNVSVIIIVFFFFFLLSSFFLLRGFFRLCIRVNSAAWASAVWSHDQLVLDDAVPVLDVGVGPLLADSPSRAGVSHPNFSVRVASPW